MAESQKQPNFPPLKAHEMHQVVFLKWDPLQVKHEAAPQVQTWNFKSIPCITILLCKITLIMFMSSKVRFNKAVTHLKLERGMVNSDRKARIFTQEHSSSCSPSHPAIRTRIPIQGRILHLSSELHPMKVDISVHSPGSVAGQELQGFLICFLPCRTRLWGQRDLGKSPGPAPNQLSTPEQVTPLL